MKPLDIQKLAKIKDSADFFEYCVNIFCNKLEKPNWVIKNENAGFRYKNPTLEHFQMLMAVKIVSTLHASVCLLKEGHCQEAGVLVRVITELTAKILCAEEAYENKDLGTMRTKLEKEYFQHDITCEEDLFNNQKWWVSMDSIHSAYAKSIVKNTKAKDSHGFMKMAKAVYDIYTGYVHGFYSSIMETYEGRTERFSMNNLKDTIRQAEMVGGVFRTLVPIFSAFLSISKRLGLKELENEITIKWKSFIASAEYTTK
ncbi:MAG: hypothetical protein H6754_06750 [Candidatus Omnitrophica bacterium]|nr:hypothetical protein [Candidatus Omnitrophota bacterium]